MRGAGLVTTKAEETRERILDAALRLFRKRGFDETTMRDIAAEAEVATGAAYYYFDSKEALVMAFYERTAEETREVLPAQLGRSRDLKRRLRTIIDHKFEQFAGHRALLVGLVRIGIDPKHSLSPFGRETRPMRDESIEFFRRALDDSSTKIPRDLHDDLPRLLWMYQMALILFWLFDDSPSQRRSKRLTDGTLDLVVRMIQLSSLPFMAPLRKRAIALIHDVQ